MSNLTLSDLMTAAARTDDLCAEEHAALSDGDAVVVVDDLYDLAEADPADRNAARAALRDAGHAVPVACMVAQPCTRCGGSGRHGPLVVYSGTCFRCGGVGRDPSLAQSWRVTGVAAGVARAAAAANAAAREAARVAAWEAECLRKGAAVRAVLDAAPDAAALAARYAGRTGTDGSLSSAGLYAAGIRDAMATPWVLPAATVERAVLALRSFAARDDERAAADAARIAAGVTCPTGRVEIVGEVVTVREQSGDWGTVYKCLIVTAAGWKVWGTLPRGAAKGDRVKFKATVEAKPGEPLFGFYSRPTAATVEAAG